MQFKKASFFHVLFCLGVLLLGLSQATLAEVKLKPYVLASQQSGDINVIGGNIRSALETAGFEVAGEYSPYKDVKILVVTNDLLKKNAAASAMGGVGALQRVALTRVGGDVQVSFTNPVYMANVYRMKNDLTSVAQQLEKALGKLQDFGAKGKTAKQLRKYHYKFTMPYFDDPYELKSFTSYDAALKAVETGLQAGRGGTSKVYRIDIPGSQQTVFGVAMTMGCSGDQYIMGRIDNAGVRSSAHLPYELLVNGKEVVALHAKFRIAQSFPDLSMVGKGSFFSIMCAPGAIEEALEKVVNKEDQGEDE